MLPGCDVAVFVRRVFSSGSGQWGVLIDVGHRRGGDAKEKLRCFLLYKLQHHVAVPKQRGQPHRLFSVVSVLFLVYICLFL